MTDKKYVCFGAGTAGVGIANLVMTEMMAQGLSEDEARSRFYLVDKQGGLLFDDMPDLTVEQKSFARKRSEFSNAHELTNLHAVVKAVQPGILIGTSTAPGTFTKEVIQEMAKHVERLLSSHYLTRLN